MNKLIIYTLVIIFTIVLIVWFFYKYVNINEHMVDIPAVTEPVKWKRPKDCKYLMTTTFANILEENDIKETKDDDYTIYFPCTYNNINDEIQAVKPKKDTQRIFIVNNADELTSKSSVWQHLMTKYGREGAHSMMPLTYVLYDSTDTDLLKKEYDPNKIYIMKRIFSGKWV